MRQWAVRRCVGTSVAGASVGERSAVSDRNRNLDPVAAHSDRELGEGITITITIKGQGNDDGRRGPRETTKSKRIQQKDAKNRKGKRFLLNRGGS